MSVLLLGNHLVVWHVKTIISVFESVLSFSSYGDPTVTKRFNFLVDLAVQYNLLRGSEENLDMYASSMLTD